MAQRPKPMKRNGTPKQGVEVNLGLPGTPQFLDMRVTLENDAKQQALLALVQAPQWPAYFESVNADCEFWTRVDDRADGRAIVGLMALSRMYPIPKDPDHAFLVGLMAGLEQAVSLPGRWLSAYSAAKEHAAAQRPVPTIVTPREGRRLDPMAVGQGTQPEDGR